MSTTYTELRAYWRDGRPIETVEDPRVTLVDDEQTTLALQTAAHYGLMPEDIVRIRLHDLLAVLAKWAARATPISAPGPAIRAAVNDMEEHLQRPNTEPEQQDPEEDVNLLGGQLADRVQRALEEHTEPEQGERLTFGDGQATAWREAFMRQMDAHERILRALSEPVR